MYFRGAFATWVRHPVHMDVMLDIHSDMFTVWKMYFLVSTDVTVNMVLEANGMGMVGFY